MTCYVGLDVSMKETAICVVDETGDRIWDGKSRTDPDAIAAVLARRAAGAVRIGIETGPMTVWLWHALTERELPVVCLHARHAAAALKLQMNKTDRNDAFGLARLVRSGWYRPVAVRSMDTHRLRALLITRDQLVGMSVNRRPKRTPYRRAKGTPFVKQRDGYGGRTVRAGCGVGRA